MSSRTERVITLLRDRMVCSFCDFYQTKRPNDRNAISELRDKGFGIESDTHVWRCTDDPDEPAHAHHRLVYDPTRQPQQMTLVS